MSQRLQLTILFADISGSTQLFEKLGDEAARALISHCLALLDRTIADHGGTTIKHIGDEVLATFPTMVQGLHASIDMQRRVAANPPLKAEAVALRIGMHHGEALLEGADVYGDAVNTAARMVQLAKREQILVTQVSLRGLTNYGQMRTRQLGKVHVSGKTRAIEVTDVIWQQDVSNITTLTRAVLSEDLRSQRALLLRFRDQELRIEELSPPLTLGRDQGNGLVIEGDWVSRNHALIQYRRGHFVFADRSTNGSYLRFDGTAEPEVRLHRDELPLRRAGTISLGQAIDKAGDLLIHYQLID